MPMRFHLIQAFFELFDAELKRIASVRIAEIVRRGMITTKEVPNYRPEIKIE